MNLFIAGGWRNRHLIIIFQIIPKGEKMENILVTGAAGFIGSKTTKDLLRDGFNVTGIDNINDYYDIRLKEHRLQELLITP